MKSTVDLAHGLGMKMTADGVETAPSLALLASVGCDIAQGDPIGNPMPLPELIATLPTAGGQELAASPRAGVSP